MKKSEEINLNKQIELITKFAKNQANLLTFYKNIDKLPVLSIQDLSFENDIAFFKELQFILSVVLSIIAKPHLNNKRDEIIARSGEVASISEEDFQKTLRDSSIWKDNGNHVLLPEYVYYHTYEDEIKIYENIFVVSLINEISFILDKYTSLYVSLLSVAGSTNGGALVMDDSLQEKALDEVNYLSRRMSQIKETYFYREVNKAKNKPKVFYPTNILLKDRLYNICFKFYKKLHVYDTVEELDRHLFSFYYVLILKALYKLKYKCYSRQSLIGPDNQFVLPEHVDFKGDNNDLSIDLDEANHTFIFSFMDAYDTAVASHKLIVVEDSNFKDTEVDKSKDTLTVEYLSPWHLGEVKDNKIVIQNESLTTEQEMVERFINDHHLVLEGSENIYSSYCPSCKNKGPNFIDGFYRCPECGAIYKFSKGRDEKPLNKVIFAKLGNK